MVAIIRPLINQSLQTLHKPLQIHPHTQPQILRLKPRGIPTPQTPNIALSLHRMMMRKDGRLTCQTHPLPPLCLPLRSERCLRLGSYSRGATHVRVFHCAPTPEFRVEDAVPAFEAELVEKAAGAALGDGVGDCAEFAA